MASTAKAWSTILPTDIDAESVVNVALLQKYHDNQESLITQMVDARFPQANSTGQSDATWINQIKRDIYIPPGVVTADGNVELAIRFEAWMATGGTGNVRMRINASPYVEVGSFTDTSSVTREIIIPDADISGIGDTLASLEVDLNREIAGGEVQCANLFSSSRIVRIA